MNRYFIHACLVGGLIVFGSQSLAIGDDQQSLSFDDNVSRDLCDPPSSPARSDIYGYTTNRDGIDKLDANFRDNIIKMIDAAKAETGIEISIYSGYRSVQHQHQLWIEGADLYPDERERRRWIAPAGRSMHNFGMAVDLRIKGGDRIEYGDEISDWIANNAHRFNVTRPLTNEGWHVEPVGGRAIRDKFFASGQTLECIQDFENLPGDIQGIILMPWSDYPVYGD